MQITISNELLLIFALALVLVIVLVFLIPAARSQRSTPHDDEPVSEEPVIEDFPDKHVQVTLPWQGFAARVLRLPYPPLSEMPPIEVAGQSWPRRVLLNVVVARWDDPDALVTQFDPRLRLKMAYSVEDLERARQFNLDYPVFGFWDGCHWVLFTPEKHNLSYEPSPDPTAEVAGHALVELAAWNDPAIAAGP